MKIKILYKTALFLFLTSVTQNAIGNELCNASVVSALKTQYTHVKSGSYSSALYEAVCEKKDNSNSFGLGLNIFEIADISFSSSGKTIRENKWGQMKLFIGYTNECAVI